MKYDNLLDTPPTTVDEVELADALQVAPASTRSRKVTTMLVALLLVRRVPRGRCRALGVGHARDSLLDRRTRGGRHRRQGRR